MGRSGALLVRWDAKRAGDSTVDSWLSDAFWYWERDHLRIDESGPATPADDVVEGAGPGEPEWLASRRLRPLSSRDASFGAAAEWEAAVTAEMASLPDGHWEDVLASALSGGAPARPARITSRPARALQPVAAPAPAQKPDPVPVPASNRAVAAPALTELARTEQPPAPAPRPAARPEPSAPVAEAPAAPAPPAGPASSGRRSDDILPGRSAKRRRFGKG